MPIGTWIKSALKGTTSGILDGVDHIIQDFVTDPDKKLQASQDLAKLKLEHEEKLEELSNEIELNSQNNITERAKADMASDNKLSKNIRPATLIYLSVIITILCILDSTKAITVDEGWKEIFKYAWMSTLSFYFIGRTVNQFKTLHGK